MAEVIFIGLDLAWSARNLSGGAVIADGVLREARGNLTGDADILQWVGAHLTPGCAAAVAIDAPLRVPNQFGGRACEKELSAQWRKYQAGPYYANRKNLAFDGVVRGEALVAGLGTAFGFVESAPIIASPGGRYVCEVFPHPAHVSLFSLERILKYKVKRPGHYAAYWQEYGRYQALLRTLERADPPLRGAESVLEQVATGLRGKKLKELEDMLDAVTCAYVASYLWRHGAAGSWVYGNVAEGHIVVPRLLPQVS